MSESFQCATAVHSIYTVLFLSGNSWFSRHLYSTIVNVIAIVVLAVAFCTSATGEHVIPEVKLKVKVKVLIIVILNLVMILVIIVIMMKTLQMILKVILNYVSVAKKLFYMLHQRTLIWI